MRVDKMAGMGLLVLLCCSCSQDAAAPGEVVNKVPARQTPEPRSDSTFDLEVPEQSLSALVRMRCSSDPAEHVVAWWKGTVFAQLPSAAPKALMGFEGYNICRMQPLDDGSWQFISRELSFYRDLDSGEIIDHWDNPYTGARTEVLHVANDPVNQLFRVPSQAYPWEVSGGLAMMTLNIPLAYPNPLQPEEFPEESSGETYMGSEHFMFFAPLHELSDMSRQNVPVSYGWTRVGPWLPWMKMAQHEGNLLYIAQGNKIDGIDDLPEDMRARIDSDFPEYARAPSEVVKPNETSWTYYRKQAQPGAEAAEATEADASDADAPTAD